MSDRVVYDLRLLEIEKKHADFGAQKNFKQWTPPVKGPQVGPKANGAAGAGASAAPGGLRQQSTVVARRQSNGPGAGAPPLAGSAPRRADTPGVGHIRSDSDPVEFKYKHGPRPDYVPTINMSVVMARQKKKK